MVLGIALVEIGGETAAVGAGGVALIPKDAPHQVRNAGDDLLRFVAVYAGTEVLTTYEQVVQTDGERRRRTI